MRRIGAWATLCALSMACAGGEAADTAAGDCNCAAADGSDGTDGSDGSDGADGTDGDDAAVTVEDVLAALPPCEPGSTDGRIDLASGCVDGACPNMTFDEINAVLGETGDCYGFWYESSDGWAGGSAFCDWADGISGSFSDDDADGAPDPLSTTWSIGLDPPFSGGTGDGLGLDVSPSCFVEQLGTPDAVSFTYDADSRSWLADYLFYEDAGVSVSDRYDARGNYVPDGRVDSLTLYGASGSF